MDGMDPALLMAVLPAQDGDRNPGIHEYRINEPVEINFRGTSICSSTMRGTTDWMKPSTAQNWRGTSTSLYRITVKQG